MTTDFLNKYMQLMKRHNKRGRCLHFDSGDACDNIIGAHSIQRQGQLAKIAENGHVYRLNADIGTLMKNEGLPNFKKIGIGQVTTFEGFCKFHDNKLFEPIDNRILKREDREQIALYAYRCLCREFFVKENAILVASEAAGFDGLEKENQFKFEASGMGHALGFQRLMRHKEIYDSTLKTKQFEDFEYVIFDSPDSCFMQASGLLYPDFDFLGNQLQNLGDFEAQMDLITFFTAPTKLGWAFCFAWHKDSSKTNVAFLQSLLNYGNQTKRFGDALLRLVTSSCENHAFKISWWDSRPQAAQQHVLQRIAYLMHPFLETPHTYLSEGCEGIADCCFKYIDTTLEVYDEPPRSGSQP